MNLPNKLTVIRMILVPVMVVFFYMEGTVYLAISTAIFIIAAVTDFLDGHIARKNNLVTDFGKFLDPIADKLLVVTALILIMDSNVIKIPYFASICLIIVIAREFIISGLRLVASNNGIVISADKLGKLKTVTQILAIILIFVTMSISTLVSKAIYDYMILGGTVVYGLSTLITIISGIQYLIKNKNVFMNSK